MPKILYVEDHPAQRDIMTHILKSDGFDVMTARDGIEGIAVAEEWQPDLILTDLRKPRMDGYEMIAHLRATERFRATPIIVVSAWASREDKKRAIDVGANEHITKPPDRHRLVGAIHSYLKQ